MSLFPNVDKEVKQIRQENKLKLYELLNKSERYRPSNGSEGSWFEDNICGSCKKYDNCKIILKLAFDYTKEIRRAKGKVFCIKHTSFKIEEYESISRELM